MAASAEDLEQHVAAAFDAARRRWPTVHLDRPEFHADVKMRRPPDLELDQWGAEEIYLTCALAAGNPAAIAVFEVEFVAPLDRVLARFADRSLTEDTKQTLRERLLVRGDDGSGPRIATFAGNGPLARWLQVAAVRTAVSLRRKRTDVPVDDGALMQMQGPGEDPRIAHLKAVYRAEFAEAWRGALRRLEPRDRTLLRLHILDGLTVARIGALHGVHATTVARWIRQIRERLGDAVRLELRSVLRIEDQELDSIVELVRSQMNVTLGGLLSESQGLEEK